MIHYRTDNLAMATIQQLTLRVLRHQFRLRTIPGKLEYPGDGRSRCKYVDRSVPGKPLLHTWYSSCTYRMDVPELNNCCRIMIPITYPLIYSRSKCHYSPHLLPGDGDHVTQLTGLSIDLDAVVQELLERSGVEDAVLHGDVAVDDKLHSLLLGGLLRLRLKRTGGAVGSAMWGDHNEKRTQPRQCKASQLHTKHVHR